jgi:hypothetical protein
MQPERIHIIDEDIREIFRLVKESEKEGYLKYGDLKLKDGIYRQDMILKREVH